MKGSKKHSMYVNNIWSILLRELLMFFPQIFDRSGEMIGSRVSEEVFLDLTL
jgi:hypothetical protein